MEAKHISAATLALIHEGEFIVLQGYGKADRGTNEPVDPPKHVFRVASISKSFVPVIVAPAVPLEKLAGLYKWSRYDHDGAPLRAVVASLAAVELMPSPGKS